MIAAMLCGGPFAVGSASADTLIYSRSAQLIENPTGTFRDVYDIFSVDTGTGFTKRLTTTPTGLEYDNADGALNDAENLLVFYSYRHRDEAGNGNSAELYTMAADGTQETRISTNAAIDDAFPQWCGNFIVFTRDDFSDGNAGDIYRINPDRSGLAPVVQTTADEFEPDCHSASNKLVYVKANAPNDRKIVVSNLDGSNPVVLTTLPTICGEPRWSQDGQWIVYSCDHHAPQTFDTEIYRMRPVDVSPADGEGDDRQRLTISPAGSRASSPVLSPSGARVGWTRETGPEWTVFWKTIGTTDDAPVAVIDGRSFLSDWK
ncbi:TolB family protein [Ruegeria atlantica]|uniref:TolB family protein n=1 Tax=Ruegeria atlantica TaxID=81569 RepID=UPI001480FA5E|nr:PD40 domain-containing protein [Ruegeria atlantica]